MLFLKVTTLISYILLQIFQGCIANRAGPEGTDCARKAMFPHQTDCTKYIVCDALERGTYKLTEKDCPKDTFFDEDRGECIAGKCEDCLPPIPSTFVCRRDGQRIQDPNDCQKYFTCAYQKYCGGKSYWGYETTECSKGKYFHQRKRRCVHKSNCPQDSSEKAEIWHIEGSDEEPFPHVDSDED